MNLKQPDSGLVKPVMYVSVVCLPQITLFTAIMPFDLPSDSETGFTVKLNPDSLIEYSLSYWPHSQIPQTDCLSCIVQ